MFKIDWTEFCALGRHYGDIDDTYCTEDQHGNTYYICGYCKWILEIAGMIGRVDLDEYIILTDEQINCLKNGAPIVQGGAIVKKRDRKERIA